MDACFPGIVRKWPHMLPVLRLLLASMVYHAEWLLQRIPSESPLRNKLPFSSVTMRARLSAGMLLPTDKTDGLEPTGIPPHVLHMLELVQVKEEMQRMRAAYSGTTEAVIAAMRTELEGRAALAGTVTAAGLRAALHEVAGPHAIAAALQEAGFRPPGDAAPEHVPAEVDQGHPLGRSVQWPHTGLPADWKVPLVGICSGWELWWLGNAAMGLPPLRLVHAQRDVPPSQRKAFSEWHSLFRRLEAILRTRNRVPDIVDARDVAHMFTAILPVLMEVCGRPRRMRQLMVSTVSKRVRAKRHCLGSIAEATFPM